MYKIIGGTTMRSIPDSGKLKYITVSFLVMMGVLVTFFFGQIKNKDEKKPKDKYEAFITVCSC